MGNKQLVQLGREQELSRSDFVPQLSREEPHRLVHDDFYQASSRPHLSGSDSGVVSAAASYEHGNEYDKALLSSSSSCCRRYFLWTMVVLLVAAAVAAAAVQLGPIFLEKVLIPFLEWEEASFSRPLLALIGVLSLALCPIVLLPAGPTMWLLGIVFGYLWGFLLILIGQFLGQTFPYFLGHWLLHKRVQAWISNSPKNAVLLRLADSSTFWAQYRTVLLLRMSPIPYPIFNYAITVTSLQYWPYIWASMTATVPEAFITIYCGKLLQRLADMHQMKLRKPTPIEIAYESIGLVLSVSVVLLGMYHGHKALRDLDNGESQEEVQLVGSATLIEKDEEKGGIDGDQRMKFGSAGVELQDANQSSGHDDLEDIASPTKSKFGVRYAKLG